MHTTSLHFKPETVEIRQLAHMYSMCTWHLYPESSSRARWLNGEERTHSQSDLIRLMIIDFCWSGDWLGFIIDMVTSHGPPLSGLLYLIALRMFLLSSSSSDAAWCLRIWGSFFLRNSSSRSQPARPLCLLYTPAYSRTHTLGTDQTTRYCSVLTRLTVNSVN